LGISTGSKRRAAGQALDLDDSSSIALVDVVGSLVLAVALAVSHPVLDLLSRNLAFFTAHQTVPLDVLGLALLLTFVLPLLVALPVVILMWLSPRVAVIAYGIILGLLAAAAALPFVERFITAPWLVVAVALAVGGLVVAACLRIQSLQTLLRWGAIVPGIVLAMFVFASPASGLVIAPDTAVQETSGVGNPVPVVLLVLDELPVQTLMDTEGNIDSTRYPGFASLLDDFTWYRNTATMSSFTEEMLPMILTGVRAEEDVEPSAVGYPNNLFTMLESSHDVWAHEELTDFCGPDICREQPQPDIVDRWQLLLSDTSVVTAHVFLPTGAASWLPPLDGAWTGFGPGEATADTADPTSTDKEPAVFPAFFDSLRSVGPHSLRFLHTLDPHFPWHALPGGLRYAGYVSTNGKGHWGDEQWVVDLAHQSHMLQAGYVDSQLVRFLDQIRDTSWYDDALVMVMADHGISFTAGVLIRGGIEDNIDDIAYVPLFVKTPGQDEGRIDDRPAMLYDVLPTVVDVLQVESAWPMEGVSLLEEHPDTSRRRVFGGVVTDIELPANPVMEEAIGRKAELFGSGNGWDTVYNYGPYRELVGQSAESLTQETEPAEIEIVDESLYDQVDPATGIVPALVRASIDSANITDDTWLAVAFNGTIAGTARVHEWTSRDPLISPMERQTSFNVIVPPTSFVTGKNHIDLYRIEDSDQGPVLHHLEDE
jgi:Sulfatase